jgi:hypothetical protein
MDTDFYQMLLQLPPDQLETMFRNYGQEQSVLDQRMGIASDIRKSGGGHSTPLGALLGGLSSVGGAYMQGKNLDAQKTLGSEMSQDASQRLKMLGQMNQKQLEQQAMWDALGLSPAAML